ncbi:MAG: glycosyltransferase family 39 protein [Chloroflexi bacterium]|nr:MAG: glycosyltransferase family 39 protein [Chloroflexota bacterium]
MGTLVTDFLIYRWRYWIGYGLIALAFIGLLLFAGLYVPGGLSQQEIASTVKSAAIDVTNPESMAVTSLPYALAQKASFELFGVSNFSIKLPSLICAFIASVGAILLLRRWFKPNVAVLATIILVTTGQFLYVAQSGNTGITYIMWSVWLLLAATMVTGSLKHKNLWKLAFFIIAGLSLYTPLSLYLLLAIISAAVLHPHVRYVLKKMALKKLLAFVFLTVLLSTPLIYGIYLNPEFGLRLLGIPSTWPPNIIDNGATLIQQYVNFISPASGVLMTPVFGLGSIALIGLGAWQLFKTRYTARSYTVTAWLVLLVPILLINPSYTSITFVPFLLLLASGLEYLFRSWYKMFPRNPYARIVGLIPLVVLVGGLVVSGIDRYVYGYHYDPETAKSFSRDLTLLNRQVKSGDSTTILVAQSEKRFYEAVAKYDGKIIGNNTNLTITTAVPSGAFAASRLANGDVQDREIEKIVVTSHSKESDRFYLYK